MLKNITHLPFIDVLFVVICLDTILGILRAFKQKKLNSTFGSNGCIRKTAMFISVICLGLIDKSYEFNLLRLLPDDLQKIFPNLGLSGFFSILFILFESISILKNMQLCGLPIPTKLRNLVRKFLANFTSELPDDKE
jgi:toxin secretion/phage lysis holin